MGGSGTRQQDPWRLPPSDLPIGRLLGELNRGTPADVLPTILRTLEGHAPAAGVRLLLADVEQRSLETWGEPAGRVQPGPPVVRIEGSPQGEVYLSGRTRVGEVDLDIAVMAPVVARAERIGVVEVRLESEPAEQVLDLVTAVGLVIGYVVAAADGWTDEFQVARRRKEMSLGAEIQWNLLPLSAFSSDRLALAGALEPAYEIAGDLYDYSCGWHHFVGGIFDAMGHGLAAARLSDLAVMAFRNARRAREPLEEQARTIHRHLAPGFNREGFVTGQLIQIDLEEPSRSALVNAGHPAPFLQRGDAPPVPLQLEIDTPFGMPFPVEYTAQPLELRPGDRLTLYSDGIVEARPDGGELYGEARLAAELTRQRRLPPRESTRRIIASVREHRAGDLIDDATLLMIDVPDRA